MSNVIRLRGKPSCAPASATSPASSRVAREAIVRITEMQLAAKCALHETLSLLDTAFASIRHLNAMIVDPDARTAVERELATLEKALSCARDRALEI